MTDADARRDHIVRLLSDEESPFRKRLVAQVITHVLDQQLNTLVDVDETVDLVIASLTGENAARTVDRHLRPGFDRWMDRWEANQDTPGDYLDDDLRARLERLVTSAKAPKAKWASKAIDPKLVRRLVAPVVQDVLVRFANRLPLPGMGGNGEPGKSSSSASPSSPNSSGGKLLGGLRNRVRDRVAAGAERVVDAGKSALGGLGAEVERKMNAAAKDFSETASAEFRDAMVARLKSDEGKEIIRELRLQALRGALDATFFALTEDARYMPLDEIFAMVGPGVELNREHPTLRQTLHEELKAVLAMEGERTTRELLDEAGLIDRVMRVALDRVDGLARDLFATEEFSAWIGELLHATA